MLALVGFEGKGARHVMSLSHFLLLGLLYPLEDVRFLRFH